MKRDIVWTTRFKKDYKLAMKRHMDISLLDTIIRTLAHGDSLPEKTRITRLAATGPDTVNVIFSRTGFSSIALKTIFWC